jgi:serine/threonine protein kinase
MLVGQQLGPFEVLEELGSGAMGAVFRARYTKNGQIVALKVMAPGLGTNATALARFERESDILKQLKHPNIVRHLAHGHKHKTYFYAMELVRGETLDQVLQRRGRMTWEEVVTLGQPLCDALQHAHMQGIVHRDLKPSNIMVLRDGTPKLTDFGIAKDLDVTQLTSANCTVGTASYMSPEQCRGERNITHKSDLYSLGVMFYELVTGQKPFIAENAMDIFIKHVSETPERPSKLILDIPIWFDTLICQLLEKKPEQRPFDAAAVGEALNRVLEKVTAQQSAGLDAAKARRIDLSKDALKPDEADKEAARALLRAGRKKKRKVKPLHERGWVQALGIVAVLCLLAGILYMTFKPASADDIYAEIEKLMQPDDPNNYEKAEKPIIEFERRYKSDPRIDQVRDWDDRIIAHNHLNRLKAKLNIARNTDTFPKAETEAEGLAYKALRYEEFGDPAAARVRWLMIRQETEKDGEQRPLYLVARRKAGALDGDSGISEEENMARAVLLEKKINEVIEMQAVKKYAPARRLCQDIIQLYEHEQELRPQVDKARKLLAAEPRIKDKKRPDS